MLFDAIDQMQSSPFQGLVTLFSFSLAFILGITFHEFSHALSAWLLGDNTAKNQGRLSLSPLVHLDPLGTAMIFLAGFGWARPTPVNPYNMRIGELPGMALTSFAGPLSNILIATVAAIPINAGLVSPGFVWFSRFAGQPGDVAAYVLGSVIFLNLLLAAFNLIPLAPLDGFKIAVGILPRDAAVRFAQLERASTGVLMALILLPFLVPGLGLLSSVIRPIVNLLGILVLGGHII